MANILDVSTGDDLKYQYFPVASGSFSFQVQTPNDAHIALTTGPNESEPMYEVFIGGWGNTKSVIRKNRTQPDVAEVPTPSIVSGSEFRGFWVRWDGGVVSAGREGEVIPFLSWSDPAPFPVSYVGVCTGWGAAGTWKLSVPTTPTAPMGGVGGAGVWADASAGAVPPGAVVGGRDTSGEPLYVARAQHEGAIIPGKFVESHGCAYVPWGGAEHGKPEYQVLVGGPNNWVPTVEGNIPPNAFPGGETEDGETLFIGRVQHEGSLTTGKVQPSHGVCYISFGGQELGYPEYEILTA